MIIRRRKSRIVRIGSVKIGGDNPIAMQSMAKTKTSDIEKTVKQIKELERAGCEIVRVAVKDNQDALAIRKIKNRIRLPVVADIHFDWCLALAAIDSGADKIRLNPGNITKKEQIKEVISALKKNRVPLRIGVNSGSVKDSDAKRLSLPDKLVVSCLNYIRIIENFKFNNIVISLKASNVPDTIEAYRKISRLCDYPLHLGVTATGSPYSGAIKSAIAIGALLLEGIGDTIRVSLTDKPQEEVKAARCILEAVGLRRFGPEIISCPTCGRCEVDLVSIVKRLESELTCWDKGLWRRPIRVAVMGCVVNGPGEAEDADLAICFGRKEGLLYRNSKPLRKVASRNALEELLREIKLSQQRRAPLI